jgi:hypothetical protein
MRIKALVLALLFFLGTACATTGPTPVMIKRLTGLNNEVVRLYMPCSEGANYVPEQEGCNPELLADKVAETMDFSVTFISADVRQPPGYDIYLATAMIHFRIAQGTLDEYTLAEQLARQFFEMQKAHSGHSINDARFYWAWFAAATASKQFYEDPLSLDQARKADLLVALGEGMNILNQLEGPRLVRLQEALRILHFITEAIRTEQPVVD